MLIDKLFLAPNEDGNWSVYTTINIDKGTIIGEYYGTRSAMSNKLYSSTSSSYIIESPFSGVKMLPNQKCIFKHIVKSINNFNNVAIMVPEIQTKTALELKNNDPNYKINNKFLNVESFLLFATNDIPSMSQLIRL